MRPLQKQRQLLTNDSWYFQIPKSAHGNSVGNTRWQKSSVSPFFVFLKKRSIVSGPMSVKFSLNINLIVAVEENVFELQGIFKQNESQSSSVLWCWFLEMLYISVPLINKLYLLQAGHLEHETSQICVALREKHLQSPRNTWVNSWKIK